MRHAGCGDFGACGGRRRLAWPGDEVPQPKRAAVEQRDDGLMRCGWRKLIRLESSSPDWMAEPGLPGQEFAERLGIGAESRTRGVSSDARLDVRFEYH